MKKTFNLRDKFMKFLIFFILFIYFSCLTNNQLVFALNMENNQSTLITEELRLKVPLKYKDTWLEAEMNIWDPWLSTQEGFLGRQIFWDKDTEQALILVNWENKKLWKNIPIQEVQKIQEKFEEKVKDSLDLENNPFKLIHEGELYKQA